MARTHEDPRPSRSVWRLPVFVRWAAPLAAAATGVALWFYVLEEPLKEPFPMESERAATEQAKTSAPSTADEELAKNRVSEISPTADAFKPDEKVGQRAAADERKELSAAQAPAESRDSNFRVDKSAELAQRRAEYSARREAAKGKLETPAPPLPVQEAVGVTAAAPAPPPPPPASASEPASQPVAASELAGAAAKPARSQTPSGVAETVTVTSDRAATDKLGNTAALRQRVGALATIEASAPDRRFRWRANGAVIERSTDGGATWVAQTAAPRAPVSAIASPSAHVAWFVGSAGTVFVFSEGTWTRVAFPESSNLTAVSAASNREAQITTVDGRVFRTTDGGQTWALQETPAPAF
jgi:photosystem II stability/assembly factor-like uncharacterized protein